MGLVISHTHIVFIMQRLQQVSKTLKMTNPMLNHTMLRIKDPSVSLPFYEKHFGMKLLTKLEVPELGFTNYFLGLTGDKSLWRDTPWYAREGVLELCHNHGLEKTDWKANNGNVEPHRGFGHICFSVSNLEESCERLESEGVSFKKKLSDGRQKNIAFALDPDNYWIELVATSSPDVSIRFNHQMIRVKDAKESLDFYTNKLGMKLIDTRDFPDASFTLYFLSFEPQPDLGRWDREGILELTHNYGTEKDSSFVYHNGNDEPQGFGHIGILVDDVDKAVNSLEGQGVKISKRRLDGKLKFIAFVRDPDNYSVELLPKADAPANIFEAWP